MGLIVKIHSEHVFERRVHVLSERIAELLPPGAAVLNVGCGDGRIAALVKSLRPDTAVEGIDVLVRPETYIPVPPFDGRGIPFPDASFDTILLVDVLHHTDDPEVLLAEAARVARRAVIVKDHLRDGPLAGPTLRFMDWVGNARHGVALPYNYWPERRWRAAFERLGLTIEEWRGSLGLYPWPASTVFGRGLHVLARLSTAAA